MNNYTNYKVEPVLYIYRTTNCVFIVHAKIYIKFVMFVILY